MTTKKGPDKSEVIKAFKVAGERAGVPGFVLGFEQDGLVTTHMEHIGMQSVSRIVIALFSQICDHEAAQGNMSDAYRATMGEMKADFLALVKRYNGKFDHLRKAGGDSGKTKTA